jgi:predicted SprT family Zn-dependent metalloprotease
MRLETAETLARKLMAKHKLKGWRFSFDNAVSRCGACWNDTNTITLSRHYVALNDLAEVRDTILHEIAHALAPDEYVKRKRRIVFEGRLSPSYEMKMLNKILRSTSAKADRIRERMRLTRESRTRVDVYSVKTELHHGKKWKEIARSIGCTGMRCSSFGGVVSPQLAKYVGTCPNCGRSENLMNRRKCSCGKCSPDGYDERYILVLTTLDGKSIQRPLNDYERFEKEQNAIEEATKGMNSEQRNLYGLRQGILKELRHRWATEKDICYNRYRRKALRSLLTDGLVTKEKALYRLTPRKKASQQ